MSPEISQSELLPPQYEVMPNAWDAVENSGNAAVPPKHGFSMPNGSGTALNKKFLVTRRCFRFLQEFNCQ